MRSGSMPLRAISAFRMVLASWSAGKGFRLPPKAPTAVRKGQTMAALRMRQFLVDANSGRMRHRAARFVALRLPVGRPAGPGMRQLRRELRGFVLAGPVLEARALAAIGALLPVRRIPVLLVAALEAPDAFAAHVAVEVADRHLDPMVLVFVACAAVDRAR